MQTNVLSPCKKQNFPNVKILLKKILRESLFKRMFKNFKELKTKYFKVQDKSKLKWYTVLYSELVRLYFIKSTSFNDVGFPQIDKNVNFPFKRHVSFYTVKKWTVYTCFYPV